MSERKKQLKTTWCMVTLIFVLSLFLALGSNPAEAQSETLQNSISREMGAAGGASGLGSQDPRKIAAGIINGALSLLGVIFLALIVYAGYLWMTAGGEESKVEEAKKLLKNAIIGLVIIIMAYSITAFVVDNLFSASSDGSGGSSAAGGVTCDPPGPYRCDTTQTCIDASGNRSMQYSACPTP